MSIWTGPKLHIGRFVCVILFGDNDEFRVLSASKKNAPLIFLKTDSIDRTGEIYTVGGNPLCRLQRPRRGRRRAICDMLVIVRSTRYERSSKIAALKDQTFNIEQDPAVCGLYAENCI